jgi:hypothetical protein
MTAFESAAAGPEAVANGSDESVKLSKAVRGEKAMRAGAAVFVSDVVEGVRRVSHNALAMLGLAAVVGALFLMGRADVRFDLESQALSWLMERASTRAGNVAGAAGDNNVELLAMAEPEAIQRATAINPSELNRQQSNVAYWLSSRYNVAPEPISRLVQEAWEVGHRVNVEPTLVLAVMAIESGFNPFAQSHVGAQGLMQVMTRVHQEKYEIFGGQRAAFDPVTNVRVGVQILKECIQRAGSTAGGLKYYVGAANLSDDGGYSARVLAEQAFLRQVASGVKVPATVTVTIPQAVVQADVHAKPAASPASASPVAPAASESAQPAPAAPVAHRPEQVAMLFPR